MNFEGGDTVEHRDYGQRGMVLGVCNCGDVIVCWEVGMDEMVWVDPHDLKQVDLLTQIAEEVRRKKPREFRYRGSWRGGDNMHVCR